MLLAELLGDTPHLFGYGYWVAFRWGLPPNWPPGLGRTSDELGSLGGILTHWG